MDFRKQKKTGASHDPYSNRDSAATGAQVPTEQEPQRRVVLFVGSPLEDASPDSERSHIRLSVSLKGSRRTAFALAVIVLATDSRRLARAGTAFSARLLKTCPRPATRTSSYTFSQAFSHALQSRHIYHTLLQLQTLPRRPTHTSLPRPLTPRPPQS